MVCARIDDPRVEPQRLIGILQSQALTMGFIVPHLYVSLHFLHNLQFKEQIKKE